MAYLGGLCALSVFLYANNAAALQRFCVFAFW